VPANAAGVEVMVKLCGREETERKWRERRKRKDEPEQEHGEEREPDFERSLLLIVLVHGGGGRVRLDGENPRDLREIFLTLAGNWRGRVDRVHNDERVKRVNVRVDEKEVRQIEGVKAWRERGKRMEKTKREIASFRKMHGSRIAPLVTIRCAVCGVGATLYGRGGKRQGED
jgi:hypothetical protein